MAAGGFNFGTTLTQPSTGLGGTTGGLTFGATPSTKSSTTGGFALGIPNTSTGSGTQSGGINFAATTTTNVGQTGLTYGMPKTTSVTGIMLGAPTTQSTGFSLTGFGNPPASTSTSNTSSLGTGLTIVSTTSAPIRGLGGVDPKTTSGGSGTIGGNGKSTDSKAVKESQVPNEIAVTVEEFKKYVKEQKSVRENIARLSSKPMFRVQEEVASLKQLLTLVSNGLQRNSVIIEKLKKESAQELKYAEMAHRTKDTPAGLQYENTAPTEYFHNLVEDFEIRMIMYRQQIEDTENHLQSFNQAPALSPQELTKLLNKLHESFVALAAHLQVVHECVQGQKEQYLNYRKVFHNDTTDIFERRKRAQEKTDSSIIVTAGPTPFPGISSAAATAMATALNRTQQPAGAGTAAPFGSTVGFGGSTSTNQQPGGFSFTAPTAAVRPLGTAFGSLSQPQTGATFGGGFGTTNQSTTLGGFGMGSQGFQLSTPPLGNKRGKKA